MMTTDVEAMLLLDRAGWTVGEYAERNDAGRAIHIVTAYNLVERIRVEGPTKRDAWLSAWAEVYRLLAIKRP